MIYNIIDIENTKQNICLRNKMVKDYLEKIRQEYIEHKVSLEEQISSYENKASGNVTESVTERMPDNDEK